jgi:sensor histidine kinase regulating citrate/malate metabolism
MKKTETTSFKRFQGKEDIQMGLDLDNTFAIMNLLRNNIYSDPIKSIVREIYSNAIDAQKRVDSTASIELSITDEGNIHFFSVRDFGASMDKEVISTIYAKMGKSDKRDSNLEHGG